MRSSLQLKPDRDRAILVGDLNVAPLEHDVWSHRQLIDVVSHTPIECDRLNAVQRAGHWIDIMRMLVPEPTTLHASVSSTDCAFWGRSRTPVPTATRGP